MPRLSESEQQEILRYLEADKPLPDKYRFLLFEDKREVELVWNGKTNDVCNIVLPFQTIEQVDEPRAEKSRRGAEQHIGEDAGSYQPFLFDLDERGRQLKGWTNKLIWGDNKLILSSLKNGPLREEIEQQGGLKLIYIDPPFDVGADFSMDIEIGGDTFTKNPSIIEEIAYRDTWGHGADSFLAMIYERLILMRDLLAEDGSIYVHCDWRVSALIRMALDEVFGNEHFLNDVIWVYKFGGRSSSTFARKHDILFWFARSSKYFFNKDAVKIPVTSESTRHNYRYTDENGRRYREDIRKNGKVYRYYLDEGKIPEDVWTDIDSLHFEVSERLEYPTQKPEALLDRVIKSATRPGDLVADFFVGSGTTSAVAEKLGRRWIATDLGKFAIHTTRKRMIGAQRELKAAGKEYRAFELLNLGKYEREHYIGVNPNLRDEEKQQQLDAKEAAFLDLILRAYRAEPVEGFTSFNGKKAGRMVAVGPVNLPVTRLYVEEIILECRQKRISRVDLLGFEFEMGLFPYVLNEAREKGIDIAPKYIPAEVFDKRAVERNQVVFHDVAAIEVRPHVRGNSVAVELTDFSVFYSQDSIAGAETSLRNGRSKIVVERGQIVKVSKDKQGITTRETLTKNWTDWIDYWSVDFNFENKCEIERRQDPATGNWVEAWTGEYIFENEWQSFRTKRDRTLELTSVYHECPPDRYKIAVKVVDIFGNDTMTIVEVSVGKGN